MNWILRKLGLKVHIWTKTHRSGYDIKCIHCGERRSLYALRGHYTSRDPSWWETTASGDGSCTHGSSELKPRIY